MKSTCTSPQWQEDTNYLCDSGEGVVPDSPANDKVEDSLATLEEMCALANNQRKLSSIFSSHKLSKKD